MILPCTTFKLHLLYHKHKDIYCYGPCSNYTAICDCSYRFGCKEGGECSEVGSIDGIRNVTGSLYILCVDRASFSSHLKRIQQGRNIGELRFGGRQCRLKIWLEGGVAIVSCRQIIVSRLKVLHQAWGGWHVARVLGAELCLWVVLRKKPRKDGQ